MKIVIIEDEAPAFRKLQKNLEEIDNSIEILEVLDSVEESVAWIQSHHEPDLFFMDIQLNDGLSFDIFDKISITRPVIFTTAFDEYLLQAFKVNGIDYLLKPVKKAELSASLKKYKNLKNSFSSADPGIEARLEALLSEVQPTQQKARSRLMVKKGDKFLSIKINDCAAFYIRNAVVFGQTFEGNTYLIDTNLEDLYHILDEQHWYRVNRQYVLNIQTIQNAEKYFKGKLLLNTTVELPDEVVVSAEKATDFKKWLGNI